MLSDPSATSAPLSLAQSADDTAGAAAARAAMVARLEECGALGPGPVREALLALPRQILMPQAYVRRSAPDGTPPCWDLLDVSRLSGRQELLKRLHSGDSIAIQHDGEPILGRAPGSRRGGVMTAAASTMSLTADLLQQLDLRPWQRVRRISLRQAQPGGNDRHWGLPHSRNGLEVGTSRGWSVVALGR
ncbi:MULTISPECIES: hypothetical protein [Streptomyces]|uniref:hypothetical protein n=1 Tax=Streptomyces TaxID=1883 RepID=UPI0004C8433D|nr:MULTISPECIES: hypothetical protein [unclassified Streptomyces]